MGREVYLFQWRYNNANIALVEILDETDKTYRLKIIKEIKGNFFFGKRTAKDSVQVFDDVGLMCVAVTAKYNELYAEYVKSATNAKKQADVFANVDYVAETIQKMPETKPFSLSDAERISASLVDEAGEI